MDITIVLGSRSDMPVADKAAKILDTFDVKYQIRVASAHRSPKYLEGIVDTAEEMVVRFTLVWQELQRLSPEYLHR